VSSGDEQEQEIDELSDFGTGLHVITIVFDSDPSIFPEVHLGDCSPWVALSILKLSMESIEILLPPINVSYKGDIILEHSNLEEEEEEDQED